MQHLGDGTVQQLEVVAHDEDRPGKTLELIEQPALRRPVEVVGRLVEDHQLGLLEEHPHQVDPPALAPGEGIDVLEEELLAQTEPIGQPGHHRLRLVAPVALELLLQIGEELDVLLRRVLGHGGTRRPQRVVQHIEAAGREDVGETGGLQTEAGGDGSLGQKAEGAQEADVAPVAELRGGLPDDNRDEGRLARAVAADQPDLLSGAYDERGLGHQRSIADFDGQ